MTTQFPKNEFLGIDQAWLIGLIFGLFGLVGCTAQEKPTLHTTISADGQMVATLLHAGTDKQLVRARNLNTDTRWHEVQAPPLTGTIRFGLTGHELLLTHTKAELPKKNYLSKLDLDKPENGLQRLYESEAELAFPVEVKPGQVMVRTRHPDGGKQQFYLSGFYWVLVGPGKQVQKVGPDPVLPYSAPNIVGDGFFWVEEQVDKRKDPHPQTLIYPLPNGHPPNIKRERFPKNTWSVECDTHFERCLREHITNHDTGGAFIYDVDTLLKNQRCAVNGLEGSSDGITVTPDGRAAVMSLALGNNTRHVVVIRFNPQQCEPVSVQHIQFEEK